MRPVLAECDGARGGEKNIGELTISFVAAGNLIHWKIQLRQGSVVAADNYDLAAVIQRDHGHSRHQFGIRRAIQERYPDLRQVGESLWRFHS